MSQLDEAKLSLEGGTYPMPGIKAVELGPYRMAYRFGITAYTNHVKGGDPAKASMQLFYDNAPVGSAHDENFDTAELKVRYSLYLEAGSTAQFRFDTDNEKADLRSYGFVFDWAVA